MNPPSIDQIRRDLQSPQSEVVGRAISGLVKLAERDESVRAEALGVFQKWAAAAQDFNVAINAAKGIRLLAGEEAHRDVWSNLLHDPRESIVMNVLNATADPVWSPVLLDMLDHRTELSVRQSLLCCLGRLKDRSVLPVLLKFLPDEKLKGYAVIALASLGDPQAVPFLLPYLKDRTPLWPVDNHGPMELMCDAVTAAIQRLQTNGAGNAAPVAGAIPAVASQPAPRAGRALRSTQWIAYGPLAAAFTTAVIFLAVVIHVLEKHGRSGSTGETERMVDLAITFPGVVGLMLGVRALPRFGNLSNLERVACIAGLLLCGGIARFFAKLLMR